MNTSPTPRSVLTEVFGFTEFLGEQQAIIEHVLTGGDGLVLMPTGGGKSLCFQIPALLMQGPCLVISPLIALMRDQVDGLTRMGVRAAALNSSLGPDQARNVELALADGQLDLVYAAPERAVTEGFLRLLERRPPSLIAIDEAHCVSQWGHDFRPEYTRLNILHQRFPHAPRLALTATADKPTRQDILKNLDLGHARVFAAGFDRPNLRYTIVPKTKAKDQLLSFIKTEHPGDAGIVYCLTRKRTERAAQWLRDHGLDALPYHAGLSPAVRQANQERFMREEGVVMAATVAFGMGVDKPNVRFVAHLDPPTSLEAYHQETGRAGRDGLPADAWMCYGIGDVVQLRRMVASDQNAARGAERGPDYPGDEPGEQTPGDRHHEQWKQQKLTALLGFCETTRCRRQALLAHFGQDYPRPCGNCDNCLHPPETWEGTVEAQKALSCVFRTGQRFGAAHLSDVLLGRETKAILRNGHDKVSTFGIGEELDRKEWLSVYRQLTMAGALHADHEAYYALKLTAESWPILKGEQPVQFRRDPVALPREKTRSSVRNHKGLDPELLADENNALLWDALRALRMAVSKEENVPPYAVFADKTLLDMVRYRPRDTDEMLLMHGVGRVKAASYAERFLEALDTHHREHGRPETPPLPDKALPPEPARQKDYPVNLTPTEQESLDLFQKLGSLETVAEQRGLTSGTVAKHLCRAISLVKLDSVRASGLPQEEAKRVVTALASFAKAGSYGLKPVHETFAGKYSFEQLRILRTGALMAGTLSSGESDEDRDD